MFAKDFLAARLLDSPDQSIPTLCSCTVSVVVVALVTLREVFDGSAIRISKCSQMCQGSECNIISMTIRAHNL